jgi:hypothetical protein
MLTSGNRLDGSSSDEVVDKQEWTYIHDPRFLIVLTLYRNGDRLYQTKDNPKPIRRNYDETKKKKYNYGL